MRKRHLTWTCIILLAGVALNVAIALSCTAVAQIWPGSVVRATQEEGEVLSRQYPVKRHDAIYSGTGGRMERFGYREVMVHTIAPWDDDRPNPPSFRVGPKTIIEVQAGWPIKSIRTGDILESEADSSAAWLRQNRHLVISPHVASTDPSGQAILPTTPIWRGFIINSLIYAVALWLILLLPWTIRQRRRERRGCCPVCAYPIGTHGRCTECGTPLPPTAPRHTTHTSTAR